MGTKRKANNSPSENERASSKSTDDLFDLRFENKWHKMEKALQDKNRNNILLIVAVLSLIGYFSIKSIVKNIVEDRVKPDSIREQILEEANSILEEIDKIKEQMKENKVMSDSLFLSLKDSTENMLAALQSSTETLGREVFPTTDSPRRAIPNGWTFFCQKQKNSNNFQVQTFRVIDRINPSRVSSYPYIGDIVKCIVSSQYIRTGLPDGPKLKPFIGAYKLGEKAKVLNVREVSDSRGRKEVWIHVRAI